MLRAVIYSSKGNFGLLNFGTNAKTCRRIYLRHKLVFFFGGVWIVAVFGGEVDALDSSIQGDNQYLELKTSRLIESQRQEQNFKRSVFMLWCPARILLLGLALFFSSC